MMGVWPTGATKHSRCRHKASSLIFIRSVHKSAVRREVNGPKISCQQHTALVAGLMRRLVCTAERVENLATQHYHLVNKAISRAIARIKRELDKKLFLAKRGNCYCWIRIKISKRITQKKRKEAPKTITRKATWPAVQWSIYWRIIFSYSITL